MCNNRNSKLWPYSSLGAFIMVPLIWLSLAMVLYLAGETIGWPDSESKKIVGLVVLVAGFIPVILVLLDYLSRRGAILSYKDWKIDFSHVDLTRPELKRESFGLPANIGVAGPIVSDTAPMDIIETLRLASHHEIVVIDLQDGNAWWVTRLLALSAGAVRAGSPNALVFVGKQENQELRFLGWARPPDILDAILKSQQEYEQKYQHAMRIAKQVEMYVGDINVSQPSPQLLALHMDVRRYVDNPEYMQLGSEVAEQILMDQLANIEKTASPDYIPNRLTLGRFNDLYDHCIYRSKIDLDSSRDMQIAALLQSTTPYIALVRTGIFESMLKREDGERLITRELYRQLQRTTPATE